MARSTVSLILAALLLSSCTDGTIQHQFRTVSGNNGWERTDTLTYDIPEIPATCNYGMQVQLRVGTRFPYRTVWVAREVELDNPHMIKRDTVRIDLSEDGRHIDASGVTLFSINAEIKPIQLEKGQKGKLRLMHLMRQETIPQLHDVGICISYQ